MADELLYVRQWAPGRDMVAVDERGDKKQRAIYLHVWATGHQELVFENTTEAESWARANGAKFVGPRKEHACG